MANEMYDALIAATAKHLDVDPSTLRPAMTLGQLSLDSLDIVAILEELSTAMHAFVEIDPDADRSVAFADTTLESLAGMLLVHPD